MLIVSFRDHFTSLFVVLHLKWNVQWAAGYANLIDLHCCTFFFPSMCSMFLSITGYYIFYCRRVLFQSMLQKIIQHVYLNYIVTVWLEDFFHTNWYHPRETIYSIRQQRHPFLSHYFVMILQRNSVPHFNTDLIHIKSMRIYPLFL